MEGKRGVATTWEVAGTGGGCEPDWSRPQSLVANHKTKGKVDLGEHMQEWKNGIGMPQRLDRMTSGVLTVCKGMEAYHKTGNLLLKIMTMQSSVVDPPRVCQRAHILLKV